MSPLKIIRVADASQEAVDSGGKRWTRSSVCTLLCDHGHSRQKTLPRIPLPIPIYSLDNLGRLFHFQVLDWKWISRSDDFYFEFLSCNPGLDFSRQWLRLAASYVMFLGQRGRGRCWLPSKSGPTISDCLLLLPLHSMLSACLVYWRSWSDFPAACWVWCCPVNQNVV